MIQSFCVVEVTLNGTGLFGISPAIISSTLRPAVSFCSASA